MKRVKTTFFVAVLMILTTYVLGVAAESVFLNNQQNIRNDYVEDMPFFVEITFTILINDGCGCNPIEGVTVSAFGGAGNDENVTNIDGVCVLLLEVNSLYTVSITAEGYIPVLFDFVIIDEQFFTFQMTVIDDSTTSLMPFINHITRILNR
jgi:hypothetical protein